MFQHFGHVLRSQLRKIPFTLEKATVKIFILEFYSTHIMQFQTISIRFFTIVFFLSAGFSSVFSQQKRAFTAGQIFKQAPQNALLPTPLVSNWVDDTHAVFTRINAGKPVTTLVDTKTGAERPYTKPAKADAYITDGDVFYKPAAGAEKRLTNTPDKEQNPTLSPDAKKLAYTRSGNLFVFDLTTNRQTQLTRDGNGVILNGYASWVYYEEILGRASQYRAFWWSPDSRKIAWMRFDDSKVLVFPIYNSDGEHGYVENQRYPQPGDPNPQVRMGIADVQSLRTTWAAYDQKADQYFGKPFWTPDGKSLWMQWMNRDQNDIRIDAVNPDNGQVKKVYEEKQKTWVDWFDDLFFLNNDNGFLLISDKSGWRHIYHLDMNGRQKAQLTGGAFTVTDIAAFDKQNEVVYFTARKENSARTDLYRLRMKGRYINRLTQGEFNNIVSVSPGFTSFIATASNVNTPLKMTVNNTVEGKELKQLFDAKGADFTKYDFARTEFVRVKTADGFMLPMNITYPLNFNPNKKYPVLITMYGGPNAGTVMDAWPRALSTQWWAKEGMIQVSVDHRASGHFGKAGQNFIFRNLGKWEISDYTDEVKWLTTKPFIDKTKICITGGSYGGYITALALTKGAPYFTHGIANFGVMDWQLYDSHYTERYMDTPKDNPEGYKNGSVLTYAGKLQGVLRIVHGTMDDNVHMQNSIQLIDELEKKGKHFEFMLYPGQRHGFRDAEKAKHQQMEAARFYYKYLLEKPMPEGVF